MGLAHDPREAGAARAAPRRVVPLRGLDAGRPQEDRDVLQGHAGQQQVRRERVAQAVAAEFGYLGFLPDGDEAPRLAHYDRTGGSRPDLRFSKRTTKRLCAAPCLSARLRTMEMSDILQSALTVAVGFVCALILLHLRTLIARIDRADKRAAEDRAANKADHDKLFQLVAGLQADVKVLRDRSDRAERNSAG